MEEPELFPPNTYWTWNRDAEQGVELDSLYWRLRYRSLWLAHEALYREQLCLRARNAQLREALLALETMKETTA